jgi:deoxyribodipyrimidine photolyase-related protein
MKKIVLILGNQLFSIPELKSRVGSDSDFSVFMREDEELCTYFRFHQQKITFFLSAMRNYRDELRHAGIRVHYEELKADVKSEKSYEEQLIAYLLNEKIEKVFFFEIEDKFFERRVLKILGEANIAFEVWQSPMFLTSRSEFENYLKKVKKPFMKVFYELQRKRLKILLRKDLQPVGGKWSFDAENRLPLPERIKPPELKMPRSSKTQDEVQELVSSRFKSHPGHSHQSWLPTRREDAVAWLERFLKERLCDFGPYEDALPAHSDFAYHSVLTPFLNTGLLTPSFVIERTLKTAEEKNVPFASLEGFIRQIIGWREFIRGIYQNYSEQQETLNFFNHQRTLSHHWYEGSTEIRPLDDAIKKAIRFGYNHHIERLMVIGSLMLLLEVNPVDAHRWFMEMYIDSSDWVMGPNVFGMALFSDGGLFATKPYFCGSNYYRKMGPYRANEEWCDGVDGLYWGFIEKNKTLFLKNPRMAMMVRSVEKMDPVKKQRIYNAANHLKERLTISS